MDGPLPFEAPEELLRQRGWMQALARSILRSPQDAEDATQEALVAALEHPPAAGRPARPWLARVVTNFAYRLRRGEGRRSQRERVRSRAVSLPDPVELFAIQQDVARAVQRLDEPLRETILLHYFGGLDTPEIARRQGVPEATVRQRLHRARERLRAALEDHYGSAPALAVALSRLMESPSPGDVRAPHSGTPQSIVLSSSWLAATAAALALALGWALWSRTGHGTREPAGAPGQASTSEMRAAGPGASRSTAEVLSPIDEGSRRERSGPTTSEAREQNGVQRLTHGFQVVGEVVDPDGRALAGAEVLVRATDREQDSYELATRADAAGRFRLESVDDHRTIAARASGLAPSIGVWIHALPGAEVPLLFVLDRPGMSVRGHVSDESGRPVAGARVCIGPEERAKMFLDSDEGRRAPPASGRTDAQGAFELEHVPGGILPVFVQSPGFAPWRGELGVAEGKANELEARLAPGARVHGRILDADGAPLAVVEIRGSQVVPSSFQLRARSDENGEFTLDGLGPGPARLVASADGLGRAEIELELAAGGTTEWDPVLDPRARIHGTLRDRDGEFLAGWDVRLKSDGDEEEERSRATDARGEFSLAVAPGSTWRLGVFAPGVVEGYPSLVVRDARPSSRPLALVLPDLAATSGRVTGRVASAESAGTGACVASASQWPGDLWCAVPLDADGRFEIGPVPPGSIEIQVQSQRFGRVRLGEHEIAAGEELDLGTLALREPGRVHGALHGLGAGRMNSVRIELRQLDADVGTERATVEGTTYFTPELQPGEYGLELQGDFVAPIRRALTIQSGVVLTLDLELERAGLRALVLKLPEPGPSPWVWCHVRDESGEICWSGAGDAADGALELRVSARPGTYRVEAHSEDGDELTSDLEIVGLDGDQPPLVLEFPAR